MARAAVALLTVLVSIACESAAERQQRIAAEAAASERALFEKRKQEVLTAPARFLETSNLGFFDKGIINSYRQLTDLTISNRAQVGVRIIKANVVWLSDTGDEVGSSPLTLKGTLGAGEEKAYSTKTSTLTSGTIQGRATRARIEFASVEVLEPLQQ